MSKGNWVDLAIVGGGASGLVAYCQARRELSTGTRIAIFNESDRWGGGLAYQSDDPNLLLNVPVAGMSLFPGEPDDFLNWIKSAEPSQLTHPHFPFLPRGVFRRYLQARSGKVSMDHWVPFPIVRVARRRKGWSLWDQRGVKWNSRFLILAAGYRPIDEIPALEKLQPARKMTCFDYGRLEQVPKTAHGLVIGSNLSAVDVWSFLRTHSFTGKLTFLSRHGRIPCSHDDTQGVKPIRLGDVRGMTPRQLLRLLRVVSRNEIGIALRLVEELRPQTQSIWSVWTVKERKQFLSHLRPYWETLRHRLPPKMHQAWTKEFKDGKCLLLAGKVDAVNIRPESIGVTVVNRGGVERTHIEVDFIVQATGPQPAEPEFLSGSRIWTRSPLKLGWEKLRQQGAWVIGPMMKGRVWEITAIPEIREQVAVALEDMKRRVHSPARAWISFERFRSHPHANGQSYLRHGGCAARFAFRSLQLSCVMLIHAVLPFLYSDQGSNGLRELALVLSRRRQFSFKTAFRRLKASAKKSPTSPPEKKAA